MSLITPFAACVEYLRLSHSELADLLSEGSLAPYSPNRAKMVCDGREPVPAFAWAALREIYRDYESRSNMTLKLHQQAQTDRFLLSKADFRTERMRRILVLAMLKVGDGSPVEFTPFDQPMWLLI